MLNIKSLWRKLIKDFYYTPPQMHEETYATGMVRPKTTALFFDKLWVHPALIRGFYPDPLEPYRVPPELCLTNPMGAGDYYDSGERQRIFMATKWAEVARIDVTEALRRLSAETWDLRSIFEIEAIQHFGETDNPLWKRLQELVPPLPNLGWGDDDDDWKLYMTTHQRNKAIAFVVQLYDKMGIRMTPVYLTPSEYDEVTTQEAVGIEVCINHFPVVDDSKLNWDQVLEFRKDKEAREMLNRLRRWFAADLLKKSPEEIKNILEYKLDKYQGALQKHGIDTLLGGMASIISLIGSQAALQLLTASPLAIAMGGLTLASGIAVWVIKRRVQKMNIQRNEVAYIYEVRKLSSDMSVA